jgi:hypothetical protein
MMLRRMTGSPVHLGNDSVDDIAIGRPGRERTPPVKRFA